MNSYTLSVLLSAEQGFPLTVPIFSIGDDLTIEFVKTHFRAHANRVSWHLQAKYVKHTALVMVKAIVIANTLRSPGSKRIRSRVWDTPGPNPINLGGNRRERRIKVKPIKMFGLAALAALLAMAFISASSAIAEPTALCTEDVETCSAGSRITHVHEVSVGKGKLLTSVATVECEVLFLGNVISPEATGAPLEIEGNFTYPEAGCETTTGTKCEVKETSTSALIEVLKTGHELAEVKGSAEVNAHCGGLINCTYNGEGLVGHGLGPLLSSSTNGNVNISEQTTNKTGGLFCPKTAKLDLTTTPLVQTRITRGAALKMACIHVGGTNGLWLGINAAGTECTTKDGTYSGEYELGWVAPGTGRGVHVCAYFGAKLGRFLASNATRTACVGVEHGTRIGRWELSVTG